MKSLAERHTDRAQRKADNASEFTGGATSNLGAAISAAQDAHNLYEGLSSDHKSEFDKIMADFEPSNARSIAEDDNGNTMAGIGVINTDIVPAKAEGGNGGGTGGWFDVPVVAPVTDGSNVSGRSLEEQGVVTPTPAPAPSKAKGKAS